MVTKTIVRTLLVSRNFLNAIWKFKSGCKIFDEAQQCQQFHLCKRNCPFLLGHTYDYVLNTPNLLWIRILHDLLQFSNFWKLMIFKKHCRHIRIYFKQTLQVSLWMWNIFVLRYSSTVKCWFKKFHFSFLKSRVVWFKKKICSDSKNQSSEKMCYVGEFATWDLS